jgi:hypothetical protein
MKGILVPGSLGLEQSAGVGIVTSAYKVRQESNETGAIFFLLKFTYKSALSPSL